jgi:hypothetical protein
MTDKPPGRRVLRLSVPVDDQWHTVHLHGPILHIATRRRAVVEIWFLDDSAQSRTAHIVRAFGTGHTIPDDVGAYIGTAVTPDGALVWHLFERSRSDDQG